MSSYKDKAVLIVDDSPEMLDQVQSMLNNIGIQKIVRATSGEEAFNQVTDSMEIFDLIICDQNMDEMSGLDLLKELRKLFSKDELPFIMLTSAGTRENIMLLVSNGGNNFIVKPPSLESLKEKIDSVL